MTYFNISEEYGPYVPVTVEDYYDLKPEGSFYKSVRWYDGDMKDVIVEWENGVPEIVAVDEED